MTDAGDFTPWTQEGSSAYEASAHNVANALLTHADSVAALQVYDAVDKDVLKLNAVGEATRKLGAHLRRHSDAQLQYTGNGFPYGVLARLVSERFGDYPDLQGADGATESRSKPSATTVRPADSNVGSDNSFFEPWTEAGATAFRASARRAAEAMIRHAEIMITVAAAVSTDEDPDLEAADLAKIFRASEHLARLLGQHGEAQYDYADDGFPFSVLARYMRRLDSSDADES